MICPHCGVQIPRVTDAFCPECCEELPVEDSADSKSGEGIRSQRDDSITKPLSASSGQSNSVHAHENTIESKAITTRSEQTSSTKRGSGLVKFLFNIAGIGVGVFLARYAIRPFHSKSLATAGAGELLLVLFAFFAFAFAGGYAGGFVFRRAFRE